MVDIVTEIFQLFSEFGSDGYGEELSLRSHMLQSAMKAESMGASNWLVVAALLHDIGYFLQPDSKAPEEMGVDFRHEALGAAWLSRSFDEKVTQPIALHVEAKRYLCAVEPDYYSRLSEASRRSLALQGGVMDRAEVARFEHRPGFDAALTLRRCDDDAKDASAPTRDLEYFRPLLTSGLRPQARLVQGAN